MSYTEIDRPSDYFNTVTYTGTNSDQSITGVNFQPDFVWIKSRNTTYSHRLVDVVRGRTEVLFSNNTDATQTDSYGTIGSFDSDGVSFVQGTSNPSYAGTNDNYNYVMWNWLANGTPSSNTDGSITSSVSANTTAGFSIISYTGTGSVATIGHGLGAVPKMIITRPYSTTGQWYTYHASLGNTHYLDLVSTAAAGDDAEMWNDTSPTSSVFTVGVNGNTNGSGKTTIAYAFAEKTGYSKFGSYTGNGNADGTFVYTGFKPAFVIVKCTSTTGNNWVMIDNKRLGYNVDNNRIYADLSNAEDTTDVVDLVSNGFKHRFTGGTSNGSGISYIYMAFGQSLVGSNNVPCTAR